MLVVLLIQIKSRNPLYFAAIPRSAWAFLDCLSPIGVIYFIEAHAIVKIYLLTFTYFEDYQSNVIGHFIKL